MCTYMHTCVMIVQSMHVNYCAVFYPSLSRCLSAFFSFPEDRCGLHGWILCTQVSPSQCNCQEMLIGLLLSDLLCKSILLSFSLIWHMCDFLSLQRFYVFLFHLKKRGKTPLHKWKIITIVLPQLIKLNATQRRYNRNPLEE